MATGDLKRLAGTEAPKFGHFIVEFATPGIGHILKSAGCDFVLFDLEHSGFSFEGVKSAEALASLPGVDCLWVGHFGLSVSLGVPGQFDSKVFKDAIAKVVTAADRHKKALGRLVPSVEQGIELNSQGFDFICYSGDVWVLHNALAEAIERLRAGCKPKKARSKT